MNCARSSPPTARGRWPGWCSSCPTSGSAQPKYLSRAESWVRKLDAQAEGSEKQFFTYSVQNRRAQELVDVLQSMFPGETGGGQGGGGPTRNVAPPYQEARVQSGGFQSASAGASFSGSGFGGSGGRPGITGSVPQGLGGQGLGGQGLGGHSGFGGSQPQLQQA